jgi:hypothetical protein
MTGSLLEENGIVEKQQMAGKHTFNRSDHTDSRKPLPAHGAVLSDP